MEFALPTLKNPFQLFFLDFLGFAAHAPTDRRADTRHFPLKTYFGKRKKSFNFRSPEREREEVSISPFSGKTG